MKQHEQGRFQYLKHTIFFKHLVRYCVFHNKFVQRTRCCNSTLARSMENMLVVAVVCGGLLWFGAAPE